MSTSAWNILFLILVYRVFTSCISEYDDHIHGPIYGYVLATAHLALDPGHAWTVIEQSRHAHHHVQIQ